MSNGLKYLNRVVFFCFLAVFFAAIVEKYNDGLFAVAIGLMVVSLVLSLLLREIDSFANLIFFILIAFLCVLLLAYGKFIFDK